MKSFPSQNLISQFRTRATATMGVFSLLGLITLSWRPFFSTPFSPIDDHEIVAYLSHRSENGWLSVWTGIYQFSPMKLLPDSPHWRPGIWMARIVEAEIFGASSVGFAFVRLTSLLVSASLLCVALNLLLERLEFRVRGPYERRFISTLFFVVFVSSPLWTDVYGRHLAAERHLILGIALVTCGFAFAGSRRPAARRLSGTTLILIGLTVLVISKENATYLGPAFGLFALCGKDQLWRRLSRVQVLWLVMVITPLWIIGCSTVFRSTFRGTALQVPYAGEIGLFQLPLLLLELPSNGYFCVLSASLVVVVLLRELRQNALLTRTLVFFTIVVVLEHVFVRSVGVTAPRYWAVSFAIALLGLALTASSVIGSRVPLVHSSLKMFLFLFALVCSVTGLVTVNNNLSWLRDLSQEWNFGVEAIADEVRQVNAETILIIVDPPPRDASGRVEKTYSMVKFLDWQLDKSVDFELALLETPSSQRYDVSSFQNLLKVAVEGTRLNGGVDIRPFDSSKHSRRFCVLYSTSGRGSPHLDNCLGVRRFTL